ncbi:MAG: hypothetical protein AAGK97_01440 [Bacteroidota bacterium]
MSDNSEQTINNESLILFSHIDELTFQEYEEMHGLAMYSQYIRRDLKQKPYSATREEDLWTHRID